MSYMQLDLTSWAFRHWKQFETSLVICSCGLRPVCTRQDGGQPQERPVLCDWTTKHISPMAIQVHQGLIACCMWFPFWNSLPFSWSWSAELISLSFLPLMISPRVDLQTRLRKHNAMMVTLPLGRFGAPTLKPVSWMLHLAVFNSDATECFDQRSNNLPALLVCMQCVCMKLLQVTLAGTHPLIQKLADHNMPISRRGGLNYSACFKTYFHYFYFDKKPCGNTWSPPRLAYMQILA